MAVYGDYQFNDFGFSLKKTLKKAKKSVKQAAKFVSKPKNIAKVIAAPLVVPTMLGVKGTTYALGKTGVKPLQKLDTKVGQAYRSNLGKELRDAAAVQYAIGAAVGGGILAAPYISAGGSALAAKLGGGATAASALAKDELQNLVTDKAKDAAADLLGKGASPDEVAGMTPAEQAAAAKALNQPDTTASASMMGPILGAVAGFFVAGPVGAMVGGAAGYGLKKR